MSEIESKSRITIESTLGGKLPAMWEFGKSGKVQIIMGRNGNAPYATYVPKGNKQKPGYHALITVHEGYYVLKVRRFKGEVTAFLSEITAVILADPDDPRQPAVAELKLLNSFKNGKWAIELDAKFEAAFTAGLNKAKNFNCNSPSFIDTSRPELSTEDKARRAELQRLQDAEKAEKRRQKQEAEAASRAAKPEFMEQLEALNEWLIALEAPVLDFGDATFAWKGTSYPYSALEVAHIAYEVGYLNFKETERVYKKLQRDELLPKFQALLPQAEEVGLKILLRETDVEFEGDGVGNLYTEENLRYFESVINNKMRRQQSELAQTAATDAPEVAAAEAPAVVEPEEVDMQELLAKYGSQYN